MKIERDNNDYGNSTSNFLSDSYYYETSTAVAELTQQEAESLFTNPTDSVDDLLDRLLISTIIDDKERFFLIGKLAEGHAKAINVNGHMHDKINSIIPYVTFLAKTAYYYKLKDNEGKLEDTIEIENKKMMLPIWLLKKEDKFSTAQNKMANRFKGEHKVSLLTPGQQVDLTINVEESKCYIESEVARWAIKYKAVNDDDNKTVIKKRTEVKKFENTETVFVDIGGGSTDAVLLAKGLNAPISKDSFQVINIQPFLGRLEVLMREKLLEHFSSVKALEKFIVDNYKKQKYILSNPNTGQKVDLTEPITAMLREYAELLVIRVSDTFNTIANNRELKYIYFGGEAPILAPYIREFISNRFSEDILERNHYFLADILEEDGTELFRPTSRTINISALEILSLNEKKAAVTK
ncbi:Alp7A family actin-like protein [Bacillus sp. Au-Bac7]|uniref:Alp7A family actin-like protein n=1 Tax=Bacillus sp. Au-Bac7 TaxID=2906458 RepID=UPI001E2E9D79|nr:hypothetical protein [Bacillus sp. Au-Bac7]MCE4051870.1 hypothetical protein [Bacillus sp. Au-Bac7]